MKSRLRQAAARAALGFAAVAACAAVGHAVIGHVSRIEPPAVSVSVPAVSETAGTRTAGKSSARRIGKLLEVRLRGTPEEIGAAHAALLHEEMVRTEAVVWRLLGQKVPNGAARLLLLDAGQLAYRHAAGGMSDARRRELAASSVAFRPDPFEGHFPPFQRFVYLTALYDISLAYEHSPLIGCTTFALSGAAVAGSALLARAFDFDVDDVFDDEKVVFLVEEDGAIPFASVAWAGLVGVVSGMNREGLAAVVHGARAGETRTRGEPVVHELRRVLSHASSTEAAVALLGETDPLVSHLVILSDASGRAVVVERIPGAAPFARELGERAAVTNHLEGPYSNDPKNLRVREGTSTLARRARGDELVRGLGHPATALDAVALLRDRSAPGGAPLPLGDRNAVDAQIATHGVVMETATRRLWVSEGPHLRGRFLAFDLAVLLGNAPPAAAGDPAEIPPDPVLGSGPLPR